MTLISVYDDRGAVPIAVEFLYRLLAEREPTESVSHKAMPSMDAHRAFVESRPYREWFLVMLDEPIGAVYLTHANEIGVAILRAYRQHGYGKRAVEQVIAEYPPLPPIPAKRGGAYVAHVNPANLASRGLFEKLGGKVVQVTYELAGST